MDCHECRQAAWKDGQRIPVCPPECEKTFFEDRTKTEVRLDSARDFLEKALKLLDETPGSLEPALREQTLLAAVQLTEHAIDAIDYLKSQS